MGEAELSRLRGVAEKAYLLVLLLVIGLALVLRPWEGWGHEAAAPHPKPVKGEILIVRSIGLRAPIVPIAMQGSVLTPPSNYHLVGWWKGSAEPGEQHGQTLITGHTVHTGGGVMNKLGDVKPGELVQIHHDGHLVVYRTTRVKVYSKAALARSAVQLFGQRRDDGRLVLVTCTDWTGSEYLSNIVLTAEEVSST